MIYATKRWICEELCTIATGEEVAVVQAQFVGERLRLRIVSESVQLVHSDNGAFPVEES